MLEFQFFCFGSINFLIHEANSKAMSLCAYFPTNLPDFEMI